MRLYHGSNQLITNIDLSKSKLHRDFGRGFYLTADYRRAVNMAMRTKDITRSGNAHVTPFLFYKDRCSADVKIKVFRKRTIEWVLFVVDNRDWELDYQHDYDIVIGPVADSRTDRIVKTYKQKYGNAYRDPKNLVELEKELRFPGSEYIQYCFCTQKGISQLMLDL